MHVKYFLYLRGLGKVCINDVILHNFCTIFSRPITVMTNNNLYSSFYRQLGLLWYYRVNSYISHSLLLFVSGCEISNQEHYTQTHWLSVPLSFITNCVEITSCIKHKQINLIHTLKYMYYNIQIITQNNIDQNKILYYKFSLPIFSLPLEFFNCCFKLVEW